MSEETENLSGLTTEEKRKILSNNENKNLISSSDTTQRKIISTTMPSKKPVSTITSVSMETTIIPEKTVSNKIIDPQKITSIPEKSIPSKTIPPTPPTPPIDSRTIPKNTISIETTSRLKTTFSSKVPVNGDCTKQLPSENKDDFCDCYDKTCPGCFFPCESCRSHKCGHQCRLKRNWKRYDRWVIQGRGEEITIDDMKIEEQYDDDDDDDDDNDDDEQ